MINPFTAFVHAENVVRNPVSRATSNMYQVLIRMYVQILDEMGIDP